ncbi:unnamed protein product [Onchocerca flexuosa]|uniref:Uncharacterized protein n=1 Tax=Onchocerca flexuosa TaxID=387005 RepID=A0A183I883_9BILA|nr:unnamed protein product [Onchocerca flexuosa]
MYIVIVIFWIMKMKFVLMIVSELLAMYRLELVVQLILNADVVHQFVCRQVVPKVKR